MLGRSIGSNWFGGTDRRRCGSSSRVKGEFLVPACCFSIPAFSVFVSSFLSIPIPVPISIFVSMPRW